MKQTQIGCLPFFCSLLGLIILGPWGSFAGFLVGSLFSMKTPARRISEQVLYNICALFAAVMKADRHIMQSELYSYRDFFLKRFGQEAASKAIDFLKELKDKNINIAEHAAKLNLKLNYTERLEILRYLFQLSYADGDIGSGELDLIRQISSYFQIRQSDFNYIYNAYFYSQQNYQYGWYQYGNNQYGNNQYGNSYRPSQNLEADYAILGVRSSDSDETIKKAYRRMAIDNHPDKVAHLGEAARKEAETRFAQINEAYQRIKKARNIS